MLTHLTIKNYALIRHLELTPSQHLNVVTGETGAGKSIMLGALGLLLGNRADTKVLWDESEKCVTEGTFFIRDYKLKSVFREEELDYDDTTVLRREISPGGKSRAFVNDTPVTLEVMRRIGNLLMDIHSQHETLQLGDHRFQLRLIDLWAGSDALLETYAGQWNEVLRTRREYESLKEQAETLRQEGDFVRFQLDELQRADLKEDEQEELEKELKISEHAEEIKTRFTATLEALSRSELSSQNSLATARAQLAAIASYSPAYTALLQRLESVLIEVDDIATEVEREEDHIDFDPQRLAFVQERLSTIYRLQKKHRVNDVKALLELQVSLEQKNALASNLDETLEAARQSMAAAQETATATARRLSDLRRKAFTPLARKIVGLLADLGIPEAQLQIECSETPLTQTGIDRIEILFSANKGVSPRPLATVASGGEFSRVMFSIKYVMTEKTSMPTLILDEIDTGVSGEVAIKLGVMMKAMAQKHQIVSITHLPQIAAKGDTHYFVYKDHSAARTVSSIRLLDEKERVEEIAKMIGGANPSRVALQNARELLAHV